MGIIPWTSNCFVDEINNKGAVSKQPPYAYLLPFIVITPVSA